MKGVRVALARDIGELTAWTGSGGVDHRVRLPVMRRLVDAVEPEPEGLL